MRLDTLKITLDYIEQNLRTEITADELAARAGYSTYHFYRIFSSEMGMSLSAYILNRRLKSALYEIARGYKAIDVVLEHGFDTYAGFYKAFIREYGCSPRKYLAIYGMAARKPREFEVKDMSISKSQVRELLKNWDIPRLEIYDVTYMNGTMTAADVWRIGDDYFLRSRAGREKQLREIAVAKAIHGQGLGAAIPLLTKSGGEYIGEDTITVLTRRVKGMPYELLDKFGEMATHYADECGRAVAKLHKALLAVEGDITVKDSDVYRSVCEWALPCAQKQNKQWGLGLSDSFFDELISGFGELQAGLRRQLIHRDPNSGNILYDGGTVSGFLDFELSERNIRLFDPCYASTAVLSNAESDEEFEKWISIAEHILKAYDAENPLTDDEKKSVFYVICSIQLIFIAYLEKFDDPNLKRLGQKNRRMLQFVAANRARLGNIF